MSMQQENKTILQALQDRRLRKRTSEELDTTILLKADGILWMCINLNEFMDHYYTCEGVSLCLKA